MFGGELIVEALLRGTTGSRLQHTLDTGSFKLTLLQRGGFVNEWKRSGGTVSRFDLRGYSVRVVCFILFRHELENPATGCLYLFAQCLSTLESPNRFYHRKVTESTLEIVTFNGT